MSEVKDMQVRTAARAAAVQTGDDHYTMRNNRTRQMSFSHADDVHRFAKSHTLVKRYRGGDGHGSPLKEAVLDAIHIEERKMTTSMSPRLDRALTERSEEHGVPLDIVKEVYARGKEVAENFGVPNPERTAMARVDSFLRDGYAAKVDADLKKRVDESFVQSLDEAGDPFRNHSDAASKADELSSDTGIRHSAILHQRNKRFYVVPAKHAKRYVQQGFAHLYTSHAGV